MSAVKPVGNPSTTEKTGFLPKFFWIALLVIVLLGGAARFYKLAEKSLWSDEIATIATSRATSIDPDAYALQQKSFDPPTPVTADEYLKRAIQGSIKADFQQSDVSNVLKFNVHPPLFFWVMREWSTYLHTQITGPLAPAAFVRNNLHPAALRQPAAFFGILSILLIGLLANQLTRTDENWRLPQSRFLVGMAITFLGFSAYQIDHAQDARPYTFLLCIALAVTALALFLIRQTDAGKIHQWGGWVTLGLLLGAGMLTQYFFMVFFGFVILYLVLSLPQSSRQPQNSGKEDKIIALQMLVALAIAGSLFILWLPYFKAQMLFFAQAGHYTAGLWNPMRLPEKLWRIFCEFFLPYSKVGKLVPAVILLTALGAWLSRRPWRVHHQPMLQAGNNQAPAQEDISVRQATNTKRHWWLPSPALGFILLWLFVVVGGQIGLDLIKDTHTATIRRYLLLASPAAYLLMAYALMHIGQAGGRFRKGLQIGLTALLLVLMLGDTGQYLFRRHHSSDEFRQAAARINRDYRPGDTVLVSKSGAMAVGMAYYLAPQTRMLGINVPDYAALAKDSPLMNSLHGAAAQSRRIWMVYSHAAPSTELRLNQWLAEQGFQPEKREKFPGVKVTLLRKSR